MNTAFTAETAIYGHVSPETARVVDDYPYGRRVRTQIRYWIETSVKNGDRFVAQTLNPKTGRWNAPKKSTYSAVMVMFVDPENDHVKHASVSMYSNAEWLEYFTTVAGEHLSDNQKAQLAYVIALTKVGAQITCTIKVGGFTPEEKAEQDQFMRTLDRVVAGEAATARAAL